MKKYIFSVIMVLLSACELAAQEALKNIKITDKISIKIPESFNYMSPSDIESRILSANKPIAVFTDPNRVVDLSLTLNATLWEAKDLAMMKDFYKSTFYATYDEVEIEEERLIEINGLNYISFKINTVVLSDNKMKAPILKYHHLLYGIKHSNLITLNFSCPLSDKKYWQDIAEESLLTIKIK